MSVTQDPRNYTVKICDPSDHCVLGTGVIVSDGGQIVTCAHVVRGALGCHPRAAGKGDEVEIYFSRVQEQENKTRRATIEACFDRCDDDVVVLKLDGPLPSGPYQRARIGRADHSEGHKFKSFGYPYLAEYPSARASGIIEGEVDPPEDRTLQADPIQLWSEGIAPGMSGAGVLDTELNHVVGIMAETWFPAAGNGKFRNLGWAVNARVLNLEPLRIPLETEPLPKGKAPEPKIAEETMVAVKRAARPQHEEGMRRAPALIEEWVGREDLLKQISTDFDDPDTRISGLVGFGGEGKSSLARQWIDSVEADGVFWWGFYDNKEVEQFFEAALTYLTGPELTAQVRSTSVRVGMIAQLLREKRVVFVLDGFEVMQHQDGDKYGQIASNDLLEFLGYFAGLEHNSFCLITTRTPLMEMIKYTSYQHQDVNRLSAADGCALLRKQGVEGTDKELAAFVNSWDGHALTLSLLGAYVGETLGGDLSQLNETPLAEEGRYERVHRVLARYDKYLGEAEQAFLTLFSAFRTPVKEEAFETVFRTATDATALNAPIAALDDYQFEEMIIRLRGYRILRYDPVQEHYTTHPLIRNHYFARLTKGSHPESHEKIKEHYLELAGDTPYYPTLDDLAPLIEAVHHACRAGAYDEAHKIRRDRIDQGTRFVLVHQLGAYETELAIQREFFPDGDISGEPQVSKALYKSWILNTVGMCLMSLGRLAEAVSPYEQSAAMYLAEKNEGFATRIYQNLANLHASLGALDKSAQAAQESLDLARRMEPGRDRQEMECDSLAWLGWAEHLRGNLAAAGDAFREAEALEQAIDPDKKYLYSNRGIKHAEHLRRAGDADYARRVTEANLEICERNRFIKDISQCQRVLGDLDADAGHYQSAREHYDQALRIARGITKRDVLIDALLGLGRLLARHPQPGESARSYLDEALGYCLEGGYKIYEADCRVALAWLHRSEGSKDAARVEADRAKAMSAEMGYHWGVVDAEEVLGAL